MMTIVMLRTAGVDEWQRVEMGTPAESLATARSLVMAGADRVVAYAIAYLGEITGDRHALKAEPISDSDAVLDRVGEPAIVAEAGTARWTGPAPSGWPASSFATPKASTSSRSRRTSPVG